MKAWANDFEGARYICERLEDLIREYQLPDNDSLVDRFETLKSDMLRKKCIKLQEEYDGLIGAMDEAANGGDYIRAYDLAGEAVNLSMDNLDCAIQDSEAWYGKVVLETPASYQKQERALEMLAYKSDVLYREGFAELRKFYQKHKLLNQGITFTPLIDRVLKFNDTVFLSGMMKYFIKSRNIDHAFRVLKKLHDLGVDPGSVAVEQRAIAYYYAEQDAVTPSELKPWEQLRD